jgi:hypothetical protein
MFMVKASEFATQIESLKLQIAELKKPVADAHPKAKEITATAQRIAQTSSIVSGSMNKSDILGGALAFMASEKSGIEDVADNTGQMVDLLKDISRKDGGMIYA